MSLPIPTPVLPLDAKEGVHPLPWWRVPTMWLVVGGPAAVVVASVFMVMAAVRSAEPVIGNGAEPVVRRAELVPAMKARNHAAAPLAPRPAP